MEVSEIKAIMELMVKNGISSLKYQTKDEKLSLSREAAMTSGSSLPQSTTKQSAETDVDDVLSIKAPFVGIFYTSNGPDDEPFVQVGDTVKKGQTVAIIESMKMMNNVVADQDCQINKVMVANGDQVEFDQPLFEIENL
ncbi:acetyl-CoA carboxylase biotin carboxyl carrier protein [Secundilactobacillus folii]|uniref:Biotin carboxyl carrier protein of acetyl-CoA carboxylase n=1 Tax=Secundilactobacillus folii TaxID=2678357 RepID=A0A7X2XV12_9LACO|nr:biotin/lipoyl-containing protein [Secundilactobacillus folii]MTV81580.1 acetyl-CoA carboxylase biotin carboxyl carrier protein subunit [Secundilactobacillus folii]